MLNIYQPTYNYQIMNQRKVDNLFGVGGIYWRSSTSLSLRPVANSESSDKLDTQSSTSEEVELIFVREMQSVSTCSTAGHVDAFLAACVEGQLTGVEQPPYVNALRRSLLSGDHLYNELTAPRRRRLLSSNIGQVAVAGWCDSVNNG